MKGFAELQTEDRRLSVLLLLETANGSANEAILHGALGIYGHEPSLSQVRTDLAWLAEQGLVETKEPGGLVVATLTAHGADVAAGRSRVPGVAKPKRR